MICDKCHAYEPPFERCVECSDIVCYGCQAVPEGDTPPVCLDCEESGANE